jgi:hypothetical protein
MPIIYHPRLIADTPHLIDCTNRATAAFSETADDLRQKTAGASKGLLQICTGATALRPFCSSTKQLEGVFAAGKSQYRFRQKGPCAMRPILSLRQ